MFLWNEVEIWNMVKWNYYTSVIEINLTNIETITRFKISFQAEEYWHKDWAKSMCSGAWCMWFACLRKFTKIRRQWDKKPQCILKLRCLNSWSLATIKSEHSPDNGQSKCKKTNCNSSHAQICIHIIMFVLTPRLSNDL